MKMTNERSDVTVEALKDLRVCLYAFSQSYTAGDGAPVHRTDPPPDSAPQCALLSKCY